MTPSYSSEHDGPTAYANFLADPDNREEWAQRRNEAVAVVQQFLAAARS